MELARTEAARRQGGTADGNANTTATAQDRGRPSPRRAGAGCRRRSTSCWCWSASRWSSSSSAGSSSARASWSTRSACVMILQVSVIGIIAVGVTQVIITGGIDLSSGSVVGADRDGRGEPRADVDYARAVYPVADRPAGHRPGRSPACCVGLLAGIVNGSLIAYTGIPPFIATLGMMVTRAASPNGTRAASRSACSPTVHACDRLRHLAGGHLPRRGADLPHRPALHALRQVHLRHRRQRAGGARLRHRCRRPPDQGLRHRRPAGRARRRGHRRPAPSPARPAWA